MSNISKFLKLNNNDLDKEIERQNKKIASAKETISLLKRLQVGNQNQQQNQKPINHQNINKHGMTNAGSTL